MKTIKIHEIQENDRYVLIAKEKGKVIDIDFYQGLTQDSIDKLSNKNKPVNTHILEIFERLINNSEYKCFNTKFKDEIAMANYACELYVDAFITQENVMETKKRMKLQSSYKEIIQNALRMYAKSLDEAQRIINANEGTGSDSIGHVEFDVMMIQAFLKYNVTINLTEQEIRKFSSNGIDLPIEFDEWIEKNI